MMGYIHMQQHADQRKFTCLSVSNNDARIQAEYPHHQHPHVMMYPPPTSPKRVEGVTKHEAVTSRQVFGEHILTKSRLESDTKHLPLATSLVSAARCVAILSSAGESRRRPGGISARLHQSAIKSRDWRSLVATPNATQQR